MTTISGGNVCSDCRHYRRRAKPRPFGASELRAPEVLKAALEWEQQWRERAEQESRRLQSGADFYYEPYVYAWCNHYSNEANKQLQNVVNPVTGEPVQVYVLCQRANADGDCHAFTPRASDVGVSR